MTEKKKKRAQKLRKNYTIARTYKQRLDFWNDKVWKEPVK